MKPRTMTIDHPLDMAVPVTAGDVLVSARTVYRVVASRPVESRLWGNRWSVTIVKVGTATAGVPDRPILPEPGCQVRPLASYERGVGPVETFGVPAGYDRQGPLEDR